MLSPSLAEPVPSLPEHSRSILGLFLDLFSSVRLGIVLLALLFLYCTIGSSGLPTSFNILSPEGWGELGKVRQWRSVELTEFEWFNWWPFNLLIGLICANIVITTIRRIPLNALTMGVWMIHGGILVLAAGSVWYFSTKVEGDAPVNRRLIRIEVPNVAEPVTMSAIPGNAVAVGEGTNRYVLTVQSIDPQWEIRSGDDVGKRAYSVNVEVQSTGGTFTRQLLADYPQYTEDIIRSTDPNAAQPMQRAIKALGKPLVDEALKLTLDYDPQPYFYLMDSHAVYLRDVTGGKSGPWVQRPIEKLPRYNDYIASDDDVWLAPGEPRLMPHPIDVEIPAVETNDPLAGVTFRISRYLRYAIIENRRRPARPGEQVAINPVASVRIASPTGQAERYQLVAFDPAQSSVLKGAVQMVWVGTAQRLEELKTRVDPKLRFTVPASNVTVEKIITRVTARQPDLPFEPIEGTPYSYRVQGFQDNLAIGQKMLSVAIVEIKSPQKMFTRWVFNDPAANRDLAMASGMSQHNAEIPLDDAIRSEYVPGKLPPAPVVIVAGPGEQDIGLLVTTAEGQPVYTPMSQGEAREIAGGVTLTLLNYSARTVTEVKPAVVPREQRARDAREIYSLIRLDIPCGPSPIGSWLPYNLYAFESPTEVLRRFPYRPVTVSLADGRQIELMFARQRMPLPAPVALDDFRVASHIGGFTGQTSSVLDWTSMISFWNGSSWTAPMQVSVNKPAEYNGYWAFQAQWDPPEQPRFQGDPGSRGLNYTVLGIGNRNGVHVQLAGCCIAVLGMIYTFYIKPMIKRRRQMQVYEALNQRGSPLAGVGDDFGREALELVEDRR